MRFYSDFPSPIYVKRQRWPDCDGNEFFRHIIIPQIFDNLSGARISDIELYGLIWPGSVINGVNDIISSLQLDLIMPLESIVDGSEPYLDLCLSIDTSLNESVLSDVLLDEIHPIIIPDLSESFVSVVRLNLESNFISIDDSMFDMIEFGAIEPYSVIDFIIPVIAFINNMNIPSVVEHFEDAISQSLALEQTLEVDSVDTQNGNMSSSISYVELESYPRPYDINDWRWWFFEINGPYW